MAQYTEQIQAFVDPETRDRIHRLADGRGAYRVSEIIREALASGLPIIESVEALRRAGSREDKPLEYGVDYGPGIDTPQYPGCDSFVLDESQPASFGYCGPCGYEREDHAEFKA